MVSCRLHIFCLCARKELSVVRQISILIVQHLGFKDMTDNLFLGIRSMLKFRKVSVDQLGKGNCVTLYIQYVNTDFWRMSSGWVNYRNWCDLGSAKLKRKYVLTNNGIFLIELFNFKQMNLFLYIHIVFLFFKMARM